MIWGSGGSKSRLIKAAGAEPCGQMRDEKLHAAVARSTFASEKITPHLRSTFGSWDVQKVHAVVVRSRFPSQNAQNTPTSDHFWKLWCRKSARHCGAKRISKSKCTKKNNVGPLLEVVMSKKVHGVVARISKSKCAKHTNIGPLLEVVMSKKSTPLWLEAHIQVKSAKQKLKGTEHFWTLRCRFAWQAQGVLHRQTWGFCSSFNYNHHYTTLHYTTTTTTITTATITTLHYTTLITVH